MVIKAPKAKSAEACERLEQLPNIGPAIAADLRRIGIERPADLRGQDPYALYRRLCEASGQRQDPCVLDTFMAERISCAERRRRRGGATRPSGRRRSVRSDLGAGRGPERNCE